MKALHQAPVAHKVRSLTRLESPGGRQVVVRDDHAFIANIASPASTTFIDITNIDQQEIVATLNMPLLTQSYKPHVAGDCMLANNQNCTRHMKGAGEKLPQTPERLSQHLGRGPSDGSEVDLISKHQ